MQLRLADDVAPVVLRMAVEHAVPSAAVVNELLRVVLGLARPEVGHRTRVGIEAAPPPLARARVLR